MSAHAIACGSFDLFSKCHSKIDISIRSVGFSAGRKTNKPLYAFGSKFQTGTWIRLLESTNFGEFCDCARKQFSAVGDSEKAESPDFRFYDSNRHNPARFLLHSTFVSIRQLQKKKSNLISIYEEEFSTKL